MKDKKTFILMIFALIIMSLSTVIYAIIPTKGEEEIYQNTFRLHIIANSDSEYDQQIKLKVRDRIVEVSKKLLYSCNSIQRATELIEGNTDMLLEEALEVLSQNNVAYGAKIETGYEAYPVRCYGVYTFPSGEYLSLRIKLGESVGKNWWCVLFPPLCLEASQSEMYSEKAEEILKGQKYKIKFKLAEILNNRL